ncbi:MAG: bifunctional DNA primase/polymerase [Dactylosporangium sp.]|nr:bifunctional DNA primase/polymerase [Dactylosporangium sp.]NNJ63530.1 bifunctional DNA primase/polymerase [Dactylosporangium sp.]
MALRAHHQALLRNATDYARRGWPVFVLGRSKRPVANCPNCPTTRDGSGHDPETCPCLTCHGFYAATLDPARVTAMVERIPRGLLAIRTGLASGLLVVDIDPAHGGTLDRTLMNPTRTVASGGGGWHLYYQHPGPPVLSRRMPDRIGVDVKADGGYVVAPPSIHPDTRCPYRPVGDRPVNEMAPALLDVVTQSPVVTSGPPMAVSPRTRSTAVFGRGAISNPTALLNACLNSVTRAPKGQRRTTLYGAARGVARIVATGAITTTHAIDELTRVGTQAQQTDKQIRDAITGAFTAEGVSL